MTTAYVTLEEMLQARDERQSLQKELLLTHQKPIISLTMNIAGPCKRTPLVEFAFDEGLRRLGGQLPPPLACEIRRANTGCEALLVYDAAPEALKETAVAIEESDELGRLFDMDVLAPDGEKLSRPVSRRCLICGGPVQVCARSRAHSLEELSAETLRILRSFAQKRLADLAVEALLSEARLTPKPGLVDGRNNGAHRDMDLPLMEVSARSLRSFFLEAARLGMERRDCMPQLQEAGVAAEKAMFAATHGVNTHKGAIFSLGLLCAASAGALAGYGEVFSLAEELAKAARPAKTSDTHGSRVRKAFGAGGARSEALSGFPHVRSALDLLRKGTSPLNVLLTLLARVEDSNLLWRGGQEGLTFVQERSGFILSQPEADRMDLILALDDLCIQRNLSPGGSADLLAAALFLKSVQRLPCDACTTRP